MDVKAWLIGLLFVTSCGSSVPCPTKTCPPTLVVDVNGASGNPIPEFVANVTLDGAAQTITCTTQQRDDECTDYGFAIEGHPQTLDIKVTTSDGTKSGEITAVPDYVLVQEFDCKSQCESGTARVVLQ